MSVRRSLINSCVALGLFSTSAAAQLEAVNPLDLLRANDNTVNENFGFSVDIDGDRAVVGAWLDDGQGAAYVFYYDGVSWSEEEKLVETGAAANNRFGFSVAIDGDRVVVGAPTLVGAGRAWVFTRTSGSWDSGVQLNAGNLGNHTEAPEQMGFSVAIDGDTIAVGERWDSEQGAYAGAIQIFEFVTGSWDHTAKLLPIVVPGPDTGDELGSSVAIDGDTVVGGAPATAGTRVGRGYAFEEGGGWTKTTASASNVLSSPGAVAGDRYGTSVGVDGDLAVVGASGTSSADGAAYVLERSGGSWTSSSQIAAPDSGEFGTSVTIGGQIVGVGAPFTDTTSRNNVGSFYLYLPDGVGGWSKAVDVKSPNVDRLGADIALDGARLLVGASTANFSEGKAVSYDLTGIPEDCAPGVCDGFMRGWRNAIVNP